MRKNIQLMLGTHSNNEHLLIRSYQNRCYVLRNNTSTHCLYTGILINSIIISIILGLFLSLFLWLIRNFLPTSNFQIGNVFFAVVIAILGSQVGEIIRKISKNKINPKIRIIAAFSMFLIWFSSIIFSNFLSLPLGIYFNIINLVGLGIGSYIAMNKNRN